MRIRAIGRGAVLAIAAYVSFTTAAAQQALPPITENTKLEITAFAVNMGNIVTGANTVMQIRIDRWSTAQERAGLITAMQEKGPDEMLKALRKMPVHGRFNIPGLQGPDPRELRLGHDIRYAWQVPDGNGRRIVFATDRYIGFAEAANQARTLDYPFTFFELHVNANGEGQGKLSLATKVTFDKAKNSMTLENYDSEPVRLNQVKVKVRN